MKLVYSGLSIANARFSKPAHTEVCMNMEMNNKKKKNCCIMHTGK